VRQKIAERIQGVCIVESKASIEEFLRCALCGCSFDEASEPSSLAFDSAGKGPSYEKLRLRPPNAAILVRLERRVPSLKEFTHGDERPRAI
jgi:hypothetical protein